jgi:hypothetical protein
MARLAREPVIDGFLGVLPDVRPGPLTQTRKPGMKKAHPHMERRTGFEY